MPSKGLSPRLLIWYRRRKRDLPWRDQKDPYRILVSEIMLQQTTTGAVKPAYERFLSLFPTVRDLARARESDVLSAWAGLGYYRRALSLHRTAREIAGRKDGWPRTARELRELPGVGPYTAAAVASIAFGEQAPALDGNVTRVMSRWGEVSGDPHRAAVKKRLLDLAHEFVSPRSPGDSNQALMELGATVCRPTQPLCYACPISTGCRSFRRGTQSRYPTPRQRPDALLERHALFVVRDERGRYLIEQRSQDGPLKGLWGFPTQGPLGRKKVRGPARLVDTLRHGIMNRKLLLEIYETRDVPAGALHGGRRRFATTSQIRKLPRSSIVEKVLRKLTAPSPTTQRQAARRTSSAQRSLLRESASRRRNR